jgi:pimeloyl-ACP methyl ester carboxylesterase
MSDEPLVALVHGGFHGAWCWDLLIPELSRRGFRTSAVDLPSQDPDLGAAAYADAVAAAIPDDEEVVVVGHSAGGLVIPLVPERRLVSRLIFLAAACPIVGKSLADQQQIGSRRETPAAGRHEFDERGLVSMPPSAAREFFYHDCPETVVTWALERLVPNSYGIVTETTPLTKWPSVPSSSIVCTEDRAVLPAQGLAIGREQLGITPIQFPGGHSPFLSRPAELAAVLEAIIRRDAEPQPA